MTHDQLKQLLDKKNQPVKEDKARASVLRATGRTENTNEKSARTAAQVLSADEALKRLLQLRDSL